MTQRPDLGAGAAGGEIGAAGADGFGWRAFTTADVPAWTRVSAAVEAVDRTGEHYDEGDLAEELADPGLELDRDTVALVLPGGEFAGYGVVRAPRAIRDVDRIYLEGQVHPASRGQGVGRRLLGWLEARAVQAHRRRFPDVPGEFEVTPYAHVTGTVRLLERSGYRPVRWWYAMWRDLADPPPEPAPAPAGLRLVPYDRARDERIRNAHNEAFADHWGSSERSAEEWAHWFTGQRAFTPEFSFVVLDGDEVAAYVLCYFWAAEAAATGVKEVYVGQLGTRPGWRGRGLASALLAQALAAGHAAGYGSAALDVDTGNATGALRLYERHGFTVKTRRVSYVKPIPAGAASAE